MARGLLVSYGGYSYTPSSLMPDNGLASLAGSLIDSGHEVEILDYGFPSLTKLLIPEEISKKLGKIYDFFHQNRGNPISQYITLQKLKSIHQHLKKSHSTAIAPLVEQLKEKVNDGKYDFVGFKLWNGQGFEGTQIMANELKKSNPSLCLFGGGPHSYSFKGLLFNYFPFDAICYDEGEETIIELADYSEKKRKLKSIPNIIFKDGTDTVTTPIKKIEGLDSLPMPVYDPDVYLGINDKMKIFIIDETRGCYYSCPFCIQSSRENNYFRKKSKKRILAEIENLQETHNMSSFRLGGQMTPGDLLESIAEGIIEKQIEVEYTCFGHINTMKEVDFSLLQKSGLVSVFYGIESGSQTILQTALHKKTKVSDIEKVLIETQQAGIKTIASMIYPAPFETDETRAETIALLKRTRPDSVLAYFGGLYPNTTWANNAEEYQFHITSENYEEEIASYSITNLLPPRFWQPLPYTLNGKSFKEYAQETEDFLKEVKGAGLTTLLSDEHFIICKHLDIEPAELSYTLGKSFFSGDYNTQESLVAKINEHNR